MTDHPGTHAQDRPAAAGKGAGGSVTRGFLFADLRGYTRFVEGHGAAAAADLLLRYRALVRDEIKRFDGAEIRTEGDSFYVVFDSVSAAVRCGLALAAASAASMAERERAIRIGIGIHAGETIETPDGYVGAPVNIAARLCALAGPGEVLVSETVRALTQTLLPVRFVSKGRRHLKGVVDPVAVFAVEAVEPVAGYWGGRRQGPRRLLAAAGIAALGVAILAWYALRPPALPGEQWTIGASLTLTSEFGPTAEQMRLGVELAVAEANAAGGVAGARMALDVRDDTGDAGVGAEVATALAADPGVVAMIGPVFSSIAAEQIPITNKARLVQCSPSATAARLTKPDAGAVALRAAEPNRLNFVRLAASDDIEATAAASFAYRDLGARSALVVDDTDPLGRSIADDFEVAFAELGGDVVRRALNPGADPADVLEPLGAELDSPALVFFGGLVTSGAPELRQTMVEDGLGDVPFLSWEGVFAGDERSSFIDAAGDAAAGSYVSRPSVGTVRAGFEERYRAAYGSVPEGELDQYVGGAYACAQIVLEALRGVAETRPSAESLRDAVRAYVVDPSRRFETVLGTVGFDENGDSIQQVVTFYRADPTTAEWVVVKQQDFGGDE